MVNQSKSGSNCESLSYFIYKKHLGSLAAWKQQMKQRTLTWPLPARLCVVTLQDVHSATDPLLLCTESLSPPFEA